MADAHRASHDGAQIAATADVDERATIRPARVWHLAQFRERASVGRNCVIGRGTYVGPGVRLGDNVKLQNHSLVYEPAELADGVFNGPAAVLTNDEYPRSVTPEGRLKSGNDWTAVGVVAGEGGDRSAGRLRGAGLDRPVGSDRGRRGGHPGCSRLRAHGRSSRRAGRVGRAGEPLVAKDDGRWICPRTGTEYRECEGRLTELPSA